ncbi:hypothetical protein VU04_02010 [Desulfobulbus sp. TB]|nr:hypothetical protein [Desulfobulbus sp. TB]
MKKSQDCGKEIVLDVDTGRITVLVEDKSSDQKRKASIGSTTSLEIFLNGT